MSYWEVWGQRLMLVGLAPLLLAQGRSTRRITPLLPEPVGPRRGMEGEGPPLKLLIAGDSAAAGVGVASQASALSGCLVRELAPAFKLTWSLVAQTGYTTADLLARLQQEPAETFDAVVLSLGVNDITDGVTLGRWLERQQALLTLLRSRFGTLHILVSPVPAMDSFAALPQPLRWCLGLRASRFNRALAKLLQSQPDCTLISQSQLRDRGALAVDGFHPSARTYRQWAQGLARCLIRRLD